jgi:osmotically-inducible protein OsmY
MPENAALTHKIKEAIAQEQSLSHLRIHLRAVDGVIFLDGEVADKAEGAALEALIGKIEGVRWVQNRLQVNPHEIPGREGHPHGQ